MFQQKRKIFILILCVMIQCVSVCCFAADFNSVPAVEPSDAVSPSRISVPAELGWIDERYSGSSSRFIICIRDRHADPFAQLSIAGILDYLNQTYGTPLVCVEGASTQLDTSFYDLIDDNSSKEKAARFFVEKAIFTGSEFYAVTKKNTHAVITGVEDKTLYFDNLLAYQATVTIDNTALEEFFAGARKRISMLKAEFYPQSMQEFEKLCDGYTNEVTVLYEYIGRLSEYAHTAGIRIGRYPSVCEALAYSAKRTAFSYSGAQADMMRCAAYVAANNGEKDFDFSFDSLMNPETSAELFLVYLNEICRLRNMPAYPDFLAYIDSSVSGNAIQHSMLIRELDMLAREIKKGLCETPIHFQLLACSEGITAVEKVALLTASPMEVRAVMAYPERYDVSALTAVINEFMARMPDTGMAPLSVPSVLLEQFRMAGHFYSAALRRDEGMAQNTVSMCERYQSVSAVLITGGFHTAGITEHLRALDISYAVVTPRSSAENYDDAYSQRMNGSIPSLESFADFFAQTLAVPLITGDTAEPERVRIARRIFATMAGFDTKITLLQADDPSWEPFSKDEIRNILAAMDDMLEQQDSLVVSDIHAIVHEFLIDQRMKQFTPIDQTPYSTVMDDAVRQLTAYGSKGAEVSALITELRTNSAVYVVEGLPEGIAGHAGKKGIYIDSGNVTAETIIHEALAYALPLSHDGIVRIQNDRHIPDTLAIIPVPSRSVGENRDFAWGLFGLGTQFSANERAFMYAMVEQSEGSQGGYSYLTGHKEVPELTYQTARKYFNLWQNHMALDAEQRKQSEWRKAYNKIADFLEPVNQEAHKTFISRKNSVEAHLRKTAEQRLERFLARETERQKKEEQHREDIRRKSSQRFPGTPFEHLDPDKFNDRTVVVLGDVHGELSAVGEILHDTGVINNHGVWTGEDTVVVQAGDVVDRGPFSAKTFYFFRNLQEQARKAGGDVFRLLGNHELALLEGNFVMADFTEQQQIKEEIARDVLNGTIVGAVYIHGRLIIHGGLMPQIRKWLSGQISKETGIALRDITMPLLAEKINALLVEAVRSGDFSSRLFEKSALKITGKKNSSKPGGPFWADYREVVSARQPDILQVVGHSIGDRIRYARDLSVVNVDVGIYRGRRGFLLSQNGGRKITAYNKNLSTGEWIADPLIDELTYRIKRIGDEDEIFMDTSVIEKWRVAARTLKEKGIQIEDIAVRAKFIVDPRQLPEGVDAYHFRDINNVIVYVVRTDVEHSRTSQEAVYHEAWEDYWISQLTPSGERLSSEQMDAVRQRAHVLASAEQIRMFGKNGVTPYHAMQIAAVPEEMARRMIGENRDAHYALIKKYFNTEVEKKIREYDRLFSVSLMERIIGGDDVRKIERFLADTGFENHRELKYRIIKTVMELRETSTDELLKSVAHEMSSPVGQGTLFAAVKSHLSLPLHGLVSDVLGINPTDRRFGVVVSRILQDIVSYIDETYAVHPFPTANSVYGAVITERSL